MGDEKFDSSFNDCIGRIESVCVVVSGAQFLELEEQTFHSLQHVMLFYWAGYIFRQSIVLVLSDISSLRSFKQKCLTMLENVSAFYRIYH